MGFMSMQNPMPKEEYGRTIAYAGNTSAGVGLGA
jgi:hypothetical protein